jgi:hypothetical protein
VKHAAALLPRTFPEYAGPLRAHPTVKMARDLADLLAAVDALHGRSPALAAAGALALAFSAHGGAKPSSAAADVAALLGFDRHAVRGHVAEFESELSRLAPLLPFASGAPPAQLVPYAPLLLRLNAVVLRVQQLGTAAAPGAAAQQQGQGQGQGGAVVATTAPQQQPGAAAAPPAP